MSCRVIDGETDDTSSSESNKLSDFASALSESKDLTDEDIEKIKKGLEDELTATQMNELIRILQKFKKGTTPKDHFEGMVSELMLVLFFWLRKRMRDSFGMAAKRNVQCALDYARVTI